jgi:hypothetical protein
MGSAPVRADAERVEEREKEIACVREEERAGESGMGG